MEDNTLMNCLILKALGFYVENYENISILEKDLCLALSQHLKDNPVTLDAASDIKHRVVTEHLGESITDLDT